MKILNGPATVIRESDGKKSIVPRTRRNCPVEICQSGNLLKIYAAEVKALLRSFTFGAPVNSFQVKSHSRKNTYPRDRFVFVKKRLLGMGRRFL